MSTASELACTYACMLLHDEGIPVTAEKIAAVVKAANVQVEAYWPGLFAKFVQKRNIEDMIMNGSSGGGGAPVSVTASAGGDAIFAVAAPVAEEKKEELKEESDMTKIFSICFHKLGTPIPSSTQFCKFRFLVKSCYLCCRRNFSLWISVLACFCLRLLLYTYTLN